MSTIELQIIGHGYNRGDGETQASERLAVLQKAIGVASKHQAERELDAFHCARGLLLLAHPESTEAILARTLLAIEEAVNASKLDEDSSQGPSEVEWVLIVDTEGSQGDASLRTSATAQIASTQRLRLDADNAEVRPDKVWPLTVTVR